MTGQSKNDPVRVLFLSDHFGHADGVIHGATRYFLTVLPRLQQQDIELSAAFLRTEHSAADRLRDMGVEPRFFSRAKWSPLTVVDVLRVLKRERVQVIHAAGMKGILTARMAGRIAGVPVVAHLHDYMPVPSILTTPLLWTSGWGTHTIAVSREVASFAKETLNIDPAETEVLANGMVTDEIDQTPDDAGLKFRKHIGIDPDAKLIGIIGRLVPVKGHDALLRAMPGVLAKEPSAKLLIIGDGPERKSLDSKAHELGLSEYVFFAGQVTDVYAALRAVDVCAIPSLSDGLPYVLLEAMAMGKPVVASAVGGLAETLRHCENGVLVRPNDAQALTKALVSVLTDPLLVDTIIKGGYETVRTFDITTHIDRLVTIYQALAAGTAIPARSDEIPSRPDAQADEVADTARTRAIKTLTGMDTRH
jgi:glycosyltransferase involved in cell wall biosynthesis